MRAMGFLVVVLIAATPYVATAHEPNYIGDQNKITIPDPETSRAYYGELTGKPAVFEINLATSTDFYLNVLAPDIYEARTDFEVVMRDARDAVVIDLRGKPTWEPWYEDFAGDRYLKGPEARQMLAPGAYTITVSNSDNSGKYVLAPGEAEVFTAGGAFENIAQIYQVKTTFFGKPGYCVYEGIIGKFLLAITAVLSLGIAYISYRILRPPRRQPTLA